MLQPPDAKKLCKYCQGELLFFNPNIPREDVKLRLEKAYTLKTAVACGFCAEKIQLGELKPTRDEEKPVPAKLPSIDKQCKSKVPIGLLEFMKTQRVTSDDVARIMQITCNAANKVLRRLEVQGYVRKTVEHGKHFYSLGNRSAVVLNANK